MLTALRTAKEKTASFTVTRGSNNTWTMPSGAIGVNSVSVSSKLVVTLADNAFYGTPGKTYTLENKAYEKNNIFTLDNIRLSGNIVNNQRISGFHNSQFDDYLWISGGSFTFSIGTYISTVYIRNDCDNLQVSEWRTDNNWSVDYKSASNILTVTIKYI